MKNEKIKTTEILCKLFGKGQAFSCITTLFTETGSGQTMTGSALERLTE